jgi:hypothetical protein
MREKKRYGRKLIYAIIVLSLGVSAASGLLGPVHVYSTATQ